MFRLFRIGVLLNRACVKCCNRETLCYIMHKLCIYLSKSNFRMTSSFIIKELFLILVENNLLISCCLKVDHA